MEVTFSLCAVLSAVLSVDALFMVFLADRVRSHRLAWVGWVTFIGASVFLAVLSWDFLGELNWVLAAPAEEAYHIWFIPLREDGSIAAFGVSMFMYVFFLPLLTFCVGWLGKGLLERQDRRPRLVRRAPKAV